jgi:hypothetical protein
MIYTVSDAFDPKTGHAPNVRFGSKADTNYLPNLSGI